MVKIIGYKIPFRDHDYKAKIKGYEVLPPEEHINGNFKNKGEQYE